MLLTILRGIVCINYEGRLEDKGPDYIVREGDIEEDASRFNLIVNDMPQPNYFCMNFCLA